MKSLHDKTIVWCLNALLLLTGMFAIDGRALKVQAGPPGNNDHGGKHSCIQEVDGYAHLSEDKTLSESRSAAFANAKRQAVEMARTYIESRTKVENFVLDFDEVITTSGGSVTVLEQKDLGVEDNKRYHVWIRAEVTYGVTPNRQVKKNR